MVWPAVILGAVAAGLVQTVTGFGSGVVLIMVLSRLFAMTAATSLNASICIALSISLAWRFRRDIDFKLVLLPAVPYLIISVCAIRMLRFMDMSVLAVAFGVFLIVLSIYFLFFESRVHLKANLPTAVSCGGVSGIFAGLFGVGGPLMALYFLTITKSRASYIATLQFFFVLSNVVSMSTRLLEGYYTMDLLPITLAGIMGITAGKWIGLKIADRLDGAQLKKVIYLFVGISGIVNVIQNLPF